MRFLYCVYYANLQLKVQITGFLRCVLEGKGDVLDGRDELVLASGVYNDSILYYELLPCL